MKKPIIVTKLKPKDFSSILILAEGVYQALLLNPDFINPQPPLPVLKTATNELRETIAQWGEKGNRGSHKDYVMLCTKSGRLHRILTQLCEWCMSSVNPDLSYPELTGKLTSTGFSLKGAKTPQGTLEAVRFFNRVFARNVQEYQVKLRWKKPLNVVNSINVKCYVVHRSTVKEFSTSTIINVVSKTSCIDEPGSGIWYYWITPVNNKGQGILSEMVIARVAEGF